MPNVTELSSLKDIPILKAGTHHSRNAGALTITEAELDDAIQGSNELAELLDAGYVPELFTSGTYARKMPGPLNLLHDDILDDTIRERVKGVKRSFGKDAAGWMTETFTDVPRDVAKAVKSKFPLRSVDLMPWKNPNTGKEYKHVVLSTAFLDRLTPPAVKGQSDDITVELSEGESPVIVLYSTEPKPQHTEDKDMADNAKQAMPDTGDKGVDVSELTGKLSEKDKVIAELQAENAAKVAELEAARNEQAAKIAELEAAQDVNAVKELMDGLRQPRKNTDGKLFEVSPAAMELMSSVIANLNKDSVIELSGEQKHARPEVADAFGKLLDLAANDGLVACVSELAAAKHTEPASAPESMDAAISRIQTDNPGMSYQEAWTQAANETKLFQGE